MGNATWPADPARGFTPSLDDSHLRCLFVDLSRINDEFERVGILMLLHQLEGYLESVGLEFARKSEMIAMARECNLHCEVTTSP